MIDPYFLTDKDVARYLNLSPAWVRGQRYKRRHGLPHVLEVDARYIGTCPRYLKSEIDDFARAIAG